MAEPEDQVARLAARRGESVPPLDPAAARVRARRNARRRTTWITAVAACAVALAIGGGIALAGGSSDAPSVHTPAASTGANAPSTTAIPTTTAPPSDAQPTCAPLEGADGSAKSGAASGDGTAAFVDVQIQTSECVDEVLFDFGNAVPAWSASYEPSGSGAGEAVLVVRFTSKTSGASPPDPRETRPVGPSGVLLVRAAPEADGTPAWSIVPASQGERRPFRVVAHDDALAIELAGATAPRAVTCTSPAAHLAYDVPPGWFVDVTEGGSACALFAPQPFVTCDACDGPFAWGGITPTTSAPSASASETIVSSSETVVAGRAATVQEVEANGAGLFPAGYRTYQYSVDWSPAFGFLTFWIGGEPGPAFDARKAGLDAIAASIRRID